jgi:predicted ribosomally synthesized peptide with SipW-like signal peptide
MHRAALTLIAIALLSFAAGNTFSYFSDVEISSGNVLQAGVWSQAENCEVDVSDAKLTGSSNKLHNIFIESQSDITITKFVLQWDCGGNLTTLKIGNYSFAVNQASPAVVSDYIKIRLNKTYPVNIWFEGLIFDNDTFTLLLRFEDYSQKKVNFVPKWRTE